MRIALVFIYFFAAVSVLYAAERTIEENIPNVIIMTFSGLRNSESIEDPTHQYIPELWGKVFKDGTLYTDLVALNHEFHMPSVHAIFTGKTYPAADYPLKAPTIFQYVSMKYGLPQVKLWSLGTWYDKDNVLDPDASLRDLCTLSLLDCTISSQLEQILTEQEVSFWRNYPWFLDKEPEQWPNWDSLGDIQYDLFKRILKKFRPKLVHYVMNDTESAHSDTFARYVLSLKKCDKRIAQLKEYIDSDPYYKGKTYLIVGVDHGRGLYYSDHIEGPYPNPGHVWMYIYGPRVKKGAVITRPVYHTDIFATVAYLMNVETHKSDGKVLQDCFLGGPTEPKK